MANEVTNQSRLVDTQSARRLRSERINLSASVNSNNVPQTRQELPAAEVMREEQKAKQEKQPDVGKAVENLSSLVQNIRRELQFSVEDSTGQTVIKVINSENKEVIRQIPAEEVISLAEHFANSSGALLDAKV